MGLMEIIIIMIMMMMIIIIIIIIIISEKVKCFVVFVFSTNFTEVSCKILI
jgi:hypothetical protein